MGSIPALADERRSWNARTISLTLAILGALTLGTLAILPNAASLHLVMLAVAAGTVAIAAAHIAIRKEQLTVGVIVMIASSLAQHVVIASQVDAAIVTPFFATIFVLIGSASLPSRWLWPVAGLAALSIGAQFIVGRDAGVELVRLQGPTVGALVLLCTVTVVAWLNLRGLERAFDLIAQQARERDMLTLQLEKSARMEALGRLAGGIAHDFNNLLVVMQGSAELAAEDLDRDHPAQDELEQIQQAAQRAGELTAQLLAFSRRQLVPPAKIHPDRVLRELEPLLQRLVGGHLRLSVTIEELHDAVLASSTQLEQVVLNMAANARDATTRGGKLEIGLRHHDLEEGEADDLPAGPYVELSVRDSGSGIPEEVMAHLFEPFFTTKEPGRGTGLGLATCFGIVHQMGGTITVDSIIDQGTTFHVYLPVAQETTKRSESRLKVTADPRQVLVVDDDPTVRQLIARVLGSEGLQVLEAHDVASSLAVAQEVEQLDIVLTDVVLGSDDGTMVLERLRKAHPEARLVVMSSFSPDKSAMDRLADHGATFLAKPFTNTQLLEMVVGQPTGPGAGSRARRAGRAATRR